MLYFYFMIIIIKRLTLIVLKQIKVIENFPVVGLMEVISDYISKWCSIVFNL